MTSAFYLGKPPEAAACVRALDRISAQAAPASKTVQIFRNARKDT